MIRLLFWLFKKRFLQLAYSSQLRPRGFEGMQKAFIDSTGKSYYAYADDLDLPILRGKEVQHRIRLIQASISDVNLTQFLDAMEKAIDGGRKPQWAIIGHLIIELRKRIGIYVDMDLLFDTVAISYIREDENPAVWDKVIHAEKVAQFKKDSQGVLYDFFYSAGLIGFIPYLGKSTQEWNEYFERSELKTAAMNQHLASIIEQN